MQSMGVFVLLTLLFISQSYGAALWGQNAANAQHTALSTQALANPSASLELLWDYVGNHSFLSGCAVDGEGSYFCYYGSPEGMYIKKLFANGTAVWEQNIVKDLQDCKFGPSLSLDAVAGTIYAFTGICAFGYNSSNGNFLWRVENIVGASTSLFMSVNEILHEGYVFGGGRLLCITNTGNIKWNITIFTTGNPTPGLIGAPPSISEDGNSLFVHYTGGLISLNADTGATIWNVSLDRGNSYLTFDSPVVDVANNYVITLSPTSASNSYLYVFDQTNGNLEAKFLIPGAYSFFGDNTVIAFQPMVLFSNGILVVNVNGAALYSFDLTSLSPVATLPANANQTYVSIAGTQDGTLYALQGQGSALANLCAIESSTMKTLQCTQVNCPDDLYFPLVVGQSSFLLQYETPTVGIASYGQSS
eukprot:Phypoly_transcript_09093.p1 GENE.Phypoly_transcript_09093~~Phypoly_transcript_09093.p1  ORF type:complete len:418 (-),score=45.85 Phypoly_transcript_09093:129-1382(-)